ncbi:FadR family transcriptional regulator [Mesorhizobium sp. M7A.F.Ca.US.001.04.1.1]|uniref:FadR/GntR family transcriptional regulator n=1 Tax=unclassified Mesorhizobium TaxID=325217 RepID=UPI000FCB4D3E|nr:MULTISPECIES: FadR/GntR family transcriptional regulator [unclassified Mesorhizobium]RUY27348.1 FadR family transcriptional regulator [Mesorhizobium sp. M7A.F.Ca.US.001.04.2.1]RUY39394.1 FadR family transcriptional regulator [Mesorhizobium sp. M7A.F.Ca.US.001.04.1.1]
MQTVTRTRLSDSVAESLRAEIFSGRWNPGERIPNEAALADLLLVSRGTVREAVRALVSQGLLDTRQGSGTYVRSAVDSSAALDGFKQAALRDQLEVLCALHVEAARLAAVRHSSSAMDHVRQLLVEGGSVAEGGHDAFVLRNLAFHKSVVAASGNAAMIKLYDFLVAAVGETVRSMFNGNLREPDQKAHEAVVDAIASGDPDRAVAAARALTIIALSSHGHGP